MGSAELQRSFSSRTGLAFTTHDNVKTQRTCCVTSFCFNIAVLTSHNTEIIASDSKNMMWLTSGQFAHMGLQSWAMRHGRTDVRNLQINGRHSRLQKQDAIMA